MLSSLLNGAMLTGSVTRNFPKFALFLVSGLKDEKLIKTKPARNLKHTNFMLEYFEHFYQMLSKSIIIIFSSTVSKLVHFFLRHSVDLQTDFLWFTNLKTKITLKFILVIENSFTYLLQWLPLHALHLWLVMFFLLVLICVKYYYALIINTNISVSYTMHITPVILSLTLFGYTYRLRSSSSSSLIVSRTRLSTVGDRAFPVAAARVWNSLPDLVTSAPSVAVFQCGLKTYPSPLWLYTVQCPRSDA